MPGTPIKCGGAPQKIMYLSEEHFRTTGIRSRSRVLAAFGTPAIFGVPVFRTALEQILEQRQIEFRGRHELRAIHGERKEAEFDVEREHGSERITLPFDLLHAVPPQSAPDFVRQSPLASTQGPVPGWAEVDKYSLQSPKHPNVFALGDASSLPTSRTGAAVRKQAPVLVENLLAAMRGGELKARYDGYSSCPLVTSRRTVMLAEFDYEGRPTPTFPGNPAKERRSMYVLKRYGLPFLYWNAMLRGRA